MNNPNQNRPRKRFREFGQGSHATRIDEVLPSRVALHTDVSEVFPRSLPIDANHEKQPAAGRTAIERRMEIECALVKGQRQH